MKKSQSNNLPGLKVINQAAIHRMVYHRGPIARSELSERLGLTVPTITTNINTMIDEGVIEEVGILNTDKPTYGRKVNLLNIVPDCRYFIGAEMRGTRRAVGVTDYRGEFIWSMEDETSIPDYSEDMEATCAMIRRAVEECGIPKEKLYGLGFCLPGVVDCEKGILIKHPGYGWENKPIAEDVRRLTGFEGPIHVNNNAVARAYSAQCRMKDYVWHTKSFAYMYISAGIACPMLYNFTEDRGIQVGIGEIGHMVIDRNGPLCQCGNHGCLEAFASDTTIKARAKLAMEMGEAPILREICCGKEPTMDDIMAAEMQGEESVCRIINTALTSIGIALANVDNFARPDVIIIDGKLFKEQKNKDDLLEVIRKNVYTGIDVNTRFAFRKSSSLGGARGGAAIAIIDSIETYIEPKE